MGDKGVDVQLTGGIIPSWKEKGIRKVKMKFQISLLVASLFLPLFGPHVHAQTSFYQGKTITLIHAGEPGGTGDMRVKAVIPFLRKYIPGNPNILIEHIPGGGGRKAGNYIFRSARPDGLALGTVGGLVANAIQGQAGVQYDLDKFIYLGATNSSSHYVFLTRGELGLNSLEKLRAHAGLRVGAHEVGHFVYITGRLFAWLIGLRDPRFVTGYSGIELDANLLRGEIDSRANIADTVLRRNSDFLTKGLAHFHSILEIPKGDKHPHPRFGSLPEIESFARSDKERKVLTMFRAFRLVGSPYILPPGTPPERAEVLKEAFRKTFRDQDFHNEYKKLTGDDASPLLPEEVEKAIREVPREREIVELFQKIAGPDPLPAR
jgi:tripartite-type tricarboxylate transporter receptor subunit TctC